MDVSTVASLLSKAVGVLNITLKRDLFLFLLKGVSVMGAVPVKARRERQSPWN